ncbi:MAG: class I SAM-dependent methyltransferase [Myxococcus sp.]|nr:class I SAM-dependent methyltransferase [Myxococcus sp.]
MEAAEFEKHERLEESHWWFEGRRRCIAAVLQAHLRPRADCRILDVGCGTGGMFPLLQRFGTVSGAEFSAEARERARRRFPHVPVVPCDLPHDVPAERYDVITAFDVIEHLDQPVEALRTLANLLRDGGQLVVTVPAFQFLWSAHDVSLHHKRRYSRSALRQHLAEADLKTTYDSFFNTSLFPVVAGARLFERLAPKSRDADNSNLKAAPGLVNFALTQLFGAEQHLLARGRLPVGVSLIAVAERP